MGDRFIVLIGKYLSELQGLSTSEVEAWARLNRRGASVRFLEELDRELRQTLGPDKGLIWPTVENLRSGRFRKISDPRELLDTELAQEDIGPDFDLCCRKCRKYSRALSEAQLSAIERAEAGQTLNKLN